MRTLETGERITLACGLSFTMPAGYDGWYATKPGAVPLDGLQSNHPTPSTDLAAWSVPAGAQGPLAGAEKWPLIAASRDGSVVVRASFDDLGPKQSVSEIEAVVRLRGRPTGVLALGEVGKRASARPSVVLRELRAAWRRFRVQGASLPAVGG